ncbi:MAG: sigma-54 dependent transcriptional regulator [Acidobacteriota bacterium]
MRRASCSTILFVDDELQLLRHAGDELKRRGYRVVTSTSWEEAESLVDSLSIRPTVIFAEPCNSCTNGGDCDHCECSQIQKIRSALPSVPIVALSHNRSPRRIGAAFREGVVDYLCKPFEIESLVRCVESLKQVHLSSGNGHAADAPAEVEVVWKSPAMRELGQMIEDLKDTNIPVLLTGESGVGKGVIARYLHQHSRFAQEPFVKVACAAMPAELAESELFGVRRGAYTGAHIDRAGKFEVANQGTIFLDEIGELSLTVQSKLLHVLADGTFCRLGDHDEVRVHVRIIAATNRDLKKAIVDGTFREDLYFRLNVVNLEIPPLRDRREDIPELTRSFLEQFACQYDRPQAELSRELRTLFAEYDWPGNVRELENLLKRYTVLPNAEAVRRELLEKMALVRRRKIRESFGDQLDRIDAEATDLHEAKRHVASIVEREMIVRALDSTAWNRSRAARKLGISYRTILAKIAEYELAQ